MRTTSIGGVALTTGAIGSLITPSIRLYQALTETISQSEITDTQRATGIAVSADTIRSNHVVVAVVVLGAYTVLGLVLLLTSHRAARGGRVSSTIAIIMMLVSVVVWSGSAIDGVGGWLLRGIITVAGVIGVGLLVSAGSARQRRQHLTAGGYPWPPTSTDTNPHPRNTFSRR